MHALDHPRIDLDLAVTPAPAPEDPILWRSQVVEDAVLDGGLAGIPRMLSTLDGSELLPWLGFERPLTGASAQVLGTGAACLVELGAGGRHRMLARETADARRHLMTPACSDWVRAVRYDELFTALDAAAHVVLWLQQQIIAPGLELRAVYDQGNRR